MPRGAAALRRRSGATSAAIDGRVGEQHGRVEVALHRPGAAGAPGGLVERHPPVDADDVGAGLGHRAEQLAGADAEVDPRHAGVGQPAQHPRRSAAATNSR